MNTTNAGAPEANGTATFEVPALKTFATVDLEVLDPEKAEVEAKKLREETLPKLKEQARVNLDWLEKIQGKSREAQDIFKKEIEERRQWLNEYLSHKFGPYRRTTWLAFLLYYFSKLFKSEAEADKQLKMLCKGEGSSQGYLRETTKHGPSTLTVFGKNYTVNSFAELGEPEIRQLRKAIADLENRVEYEERMIYQNKIKALLDAGKLSTDELLKGERGLFSALSRTNGSPQSEGAILVFSSGRDIFVRQALGAFQTKMEELKKRDKPLFLPILEWEKISPNFFTEKARVDKETGELLMVLWEVLKNGIIWKARKEGVQAWREECQKMAADIEPGKFLNDRTQAGFCFLEVEGKFDWRTPNKVTKETTISNLFFVVERKLGENGQSTIRLAKYPPWLNELFLECKGKDWPEGEKFADLPQNLQMVLRKIWGQIEKRSQIKQHA